MACCARPRPVRSEPSTTLRRASGPAPPSCGGGLASGSRILGAGGQSGMQPIAPRVHQGGQDDAERGSEPGPNPVLTEGPPTAQREQREQRVTPLELFFDLVF